MENQYVDMGNRIKMRRKELHMKQSELAEQIDISNNHMSSIETGKQKPSIDTFVKICESLRVTPDYLLLGNMHSNNVSQNITDKLRLCSKEDIELVHKFIEILVERNKGTWNDTHFI